MPDRCEHCERDIYQPTNVQELIEFAFVAEKAAHERTNAKLAAALDEITLLNDLLATEKGTHAESRAAAVAVLGFSELLRDADQQLLLTESDLYQALGERYRLREALEDARLWGFDDAYHWYEDVIEWLGDWHDEESSDAPEDLIAEVKAYVTELETDGEQALEERDRLREALRDLKGRWEQVQEAWDDEDRVAYSTAAEAVMVAESYLYGAIADACAVLATIPAEHVEPT